MSVIHHIKKESIVIGIVSILICEMAGFVGALYTTPSIPGWYVGIVKPLFTPPSWVFAPVWTALFALMGIALSLIWRVPSTAYSIKIKRIGLVLFGVQLVLNIVWSMLFFGLHNPLWAFIEIDILWVAIIATILVFHKLSRVAAWLLVPYVVWVSFAAFLTYYIWMLN